MQQTEEKNWRRIITCWIGVVDGEDKDYCRVLCSSTIKRSDALKCKPNDWSVVDWANRREELVKEHLQKDCLSDSYKSMLSDLFSQKRKFCSYAFSRKKFLSSQQLQLVLQNRWSEFISKLINFRSSSLAYINMQIWQITKCTLWDIPHTPPANQKMLFFAYHGDNINTYHS